MEKKIYVNNGKIKVREKLSIFKDEFNDIVSQLNNQQAEINRLRTALENLIEAFLILKRFYPTTTLFADEHIKNINKALNGESEER